MKQRIGLIAVLLFASVFALSGRAAAQTSNGKVRFLHAVPGAPAVDVFVDNVLAARKLDYANATRYLTIPLGDHAVIVQATASGAAPSGTSLLSAQVKITADEPNKLVVVGGTTAAPEAAVYAQDLGKVGVGKARVTAIHAISAAPAVDVRRSDGSPFVDGLKYGQSYGEFDIPAAALELAVVPAGGELSAAVIKPAIVGLSAGTHNTLVAIGALEGAVKPQLILLTTPTDSSDAGNILVRFVNTVNSGKAIDVYLDGQLIAPALNFRQNTEHIPLAAGAGKVELRQTGDAPTAAAIGSATIALDSAAGPALTAIISGTADALTVTAFKNDVSKLDSSKARVNVFNLLSAPATFSAGGKALITDSVSTQTSTPTELTRGVYRFELTVPDLKIDVKGNLTVNGGTLADLIIGGTAAAPAIVLASTGLSETIGSAPVNTTPDEAIQPVAAAPTPTIVQKAGPTATLAPVSTVAPAGVSTQAPPAATQRPANQPGATGLVITNDGVNLKLREYPRTDAKTLTLIPSGSTVKVLGVKGPNSKTATPAAPSTKAKTPTLVATARADIWLFVEWQTPEGATVTGWTIAQYLDITINGRLIGRTNITDVLALPQIPDDKFGVADTGSATAIPGDDKRTIGTVTTEVGTNVQLRRTPNVKGESLSLVPSGAIVYILGKTEVAPTGNVGEPKSAIWFNVQYDVEGATIIGWMSADFLSLSIKYNGKPVDVKDVPVVSTITPGAIRGNATQVQPAAKPGTTAIVINIVAGSNLQLRRNPDASAESLALIPSSSEVEVIGRNGSGAWIQIKFGANVGWANASFLRITKNGKAVSIKDLKIVNGEKDTFGTTTPTVTPVGAG